MPAYIVNVLNQVEEYYNIVLGLLLVPDTTVIADK